jgi:probable phosphoglycerate mutase
MTTFYLIRHTERSGDPQQLAGRQSGVVLTDAGRAHAERIAHVLAQHPIARVFCSPQERAQQTAEPLARRRGLRAEVSRAIDEIDFGEWTGKTFAELALDKRWLCFNQDRGKTAAPRGESLAAVQVRFVEALRLWRDMYPENEIAVVSHADPIKLALAHFSGLPLAEFDRFEIGLGSISMVEVDHRGGRVRRCNDSATTLAA